MTRTIEYLLIAIFSAMAVSCAKPGEEFIHTDNTISSIWITPTDNASWIVYGDINEETGEISFVIPRSMSPYFPSLTELKVRAIVGYDAFITPSLLGIKDLSRDLVITVTAIQTGEQREYTLWADYE